MSFAEELRQAAGWSEHQDFPAPGWDDLLERAADFVEAFSDLLPATRDDVVVATRYWRTNADLILDAYRLGYVKGRVLDVTPGEKSLWLRRVLEEDVGPGLPKGIISVVMNSERHDFRNLPYSNNCFDTVLYDPPYKLNGNPNGLAELSKRYGVDVPTRWQDRHIMMAEGLIQCERILAPRGYLLVKCQDQVVSGKLRWQTRMLTEVARCTLVDRFDMLGHHIPQPMEGRTQKHAHGRPSTLLVFQKG